MSLTLHPVPLPVLAVLPVPAHHREGVDHQGQREGQQHHHERQQQQLQRCQVGAGSRGLGRAGRGRWRVDQAGLYVIFSVFLVFVSSAFSQMRSNLEDYLIVMTFSNIKGTRSSTIIMIIIWQELCNVSLVIMIGRCL